MVDTVIHYRFLCRGGLAATLAAVNEIPLKRELVLETDTLRFKFGDGVTAYNALPYAVAGAMVHTVDAVPTAAVGRDGDYAIWPRSGDPLLFGPRAGNTWPPGVPLKGIKGDTGNTGSQGARGADGLSAYQVAVANGFAGTQAEWLIALKGAKGDRGEQGPAGLPSLRRIHTVGNSDTGSVACDWSAFDEIRVTLTTDTTFTFSGALDGQGCVLKLRQDNAGGHAAMLPAGVRVNAIIAAYVPTVAAMQADILGFRYDGQDARYDIVSLIPGVGA